ncbi:MAG: very short patch repair endonuclease [Acidobacteriota bacterium]
MDTLSRQERSVRMSLIRSGDTKPERLLRSALHRAGFRFRLHDRALPGTPDIVFPKLRRVVFVHGCFWHSHRCQGPSRRPKTNPRYWLPKLEANKRRDARNMRRIRSLGWRALTIWECELRAVDKAVAKATRFLRRPLLAATRNR